MSRSRSTPRAVTPSPDAAPAEPEPPVATEAAELALDELVEFSAAPTEPPPGAGWNNVTKRWILNGEVMDPQPPPPPPCPAHLLGVPLGVRVHL